MSIFQITTYELRRFSLILCAYFLHELIPSHIRQALVLFHVLLGLTGCVLWLICFKVWQFHMSFFDHQTHTTIINSDSILGLVNAYRIVILSIFMLKFHAKIIVQNKIHLHSQFSIFLLFWLFSPRSFYVDTYMVV